MSLRVVHGVLELCFSDRRTGIGRRARRTGLREKIFAYVRLTIRLVLTLQQTPLLRHRMVRARMTRELRDLLSNDRRNTTILAPPLPRGACCKPLDTPSTDTLLTLKWTSRSCRPPSPLRTRADSYSTPEEHARSAISSAAVLARHNEDLLITPSSLIQKVPDQSGLMTFHHRPLALLHHREKSIYDATNAVKVRGRLRLVERKMFVGGKSRRIASVVHGWFGDGLLRSYCLGG